MNGILDTVNSPRPAEIPTPCVDLDFTTTVAALIGVPDATLRIYHMLVSEADRMLSVVFAPVLIQLHIACLSRRDRQPPFYISSEEGHRFGERTIAELLSGIRTFGASPTFSHRHLAQVGDELPEALLGTAGTTRRWLSRSG